jgi:hypothetical protein
MSDQTERTIVHDLADVVGELTRRHAELLSSLKSVRDDLQGPRAVGDDERRSPRPTRPPARPGEAASPPPGNEAVSKSRVVDTSPRPKVNGVHRPDAGGDSELWILRPVDLGVLPHPLTRRHYDYFAELDDLLARLPVTTVPDEPKAPLDH